MTQPVIFYSNSTSQFVYFQNSGTNDPNCPKLEIYDNLSDFNLGSGKFTVDFWAKCLSVVGRKMFSFPIISSVGTTRRVILSVGPGKQWASGRQVSGMGLYSEHSYSFYFGTEESTLYECLGGSTDSTTIPYNVWTHFALVRNGSTQNDWYFFINGLSQPLVWFDMLATFPNKSFTLWNFDFWNARTGNGIHANIGSEYNDYSLNGYLDNFRVTPGVARWTSNFTPNYPMTQATSAGDVLYFKFDQDVKDETGRHIVTGTAGVGINTINLIFNYGDGNPVVFHERADEKPVVFYSN